MHREMHSFALKSTSAVSRGLPPILLIMSVVFSTKTLMIRRNIFINYVPPKAQLSTVNIIGRPTHRILASGYRKRLSAGTDTNKTSSNFFAPLTCIHLPKLALQ